MNFHALYGDISTDFVPALVGMLLKRRHMVNEVKRNDFRKPIIIDWTNWGFVDEKWYVHYDSELKKAISLLS